MNNKLPDELIKEWHPTKNGDLFPQNVSRGSREKVWWKCSKCGYEYFTKINSRTNGTGCKECYRNSRIKNKFIQ